MTDIACKHDFRHLFNLAAEISLNQHEKIHQRSVEEGVLHARKNIRQVTQASYYFHDTKGPPDFKATSCLVLSELNVYREKYIAGYLANEIDKLTDLENTVLDALRKKETISDKVEESEKLTPGQYLADNVAAFGGSCKVHHRFRTLYARMDWNQCILVFFEGF